MNAHLENTQRCGAEPTARDLLLPSAWVQAQRLRKTDSYIMLSSMAVLAPYHALNHETGL